MYLDVGGLKTGFWRISSFIAYLLVASKLVFEESLAYSLFIEESIVYIYLYIENLKLWFWCYGYYTYGWQIHY